MNRAKLLSIGLTFMVCGCIPADLGTRAGDAKYSEAFPFESRFVTVNGVSVHYVQAGTRNPPILLLHGLPANCYLWRNVIPLLSPHARVIAFDFVGFGKSDKPTDSVYTIQAFTACLQGFIQALDLKNVTLVGMDLGLIAGMNYAMAHPDNVAGIVMFEGFFLPIDTAMRFQPLRNRLIMRLMRNPAFAGRSLVKKENCVASMITMMTARKLGVEAMRRYTQPFADTAVRRAVLFNGVGPHTIWPKKPAAGSTAAVIAGYSEKLNHSPIPKLLCFVEPGSAVSKKTIAYAQSHIDSLRICCLGKGKHFVPEDQPESLGKAIAAFYQRFCAHLVSQ
jgi:haloalkane dehalogenase